MHIIRQAPLSIHCRQHLSSVLRDTREILNHRSKEEQKLQRQGEESAANEKGVAAAAESVDGNTAEKASREADADAAGEARAYREPSLSSELLRARLHSASKEKEKLGKELHSDIVRLAASGLLPAEVTGQVWGRLWGQ